MIKKISVLSLVIIIVAVAVSLTSGNKKGNPMVTVSEVSPTAQESTISQSEKQIQETNVIVTNSAFEPQTINIKVGTKVIWTNKSGGFANVSSDPHPTHINYPPLNLGRFEDNQTVELVFDKSGEFKYHNHLNPSAIGTIIVE